MAIGVMSQYTGKILWRSPDNSAGLGTFRVNGATELRAGYVCTQTDHTHPDIAKPDGDADITLGVVLNHPATALDSDFADDLEVQVALKHSGAGVWVFVDDNEGALIAGTPMYSTGTDNDGFVETMAVAEVGTAWATAAVQGFMSKIVHRYVGITVRAEPDQGSTDVPARLLLV